MQLSHQSEWMKAQKHADVMAPSGHFDVIQAQDETSVFFSLGTDGVLYATKEVQTSNVGWNREDLSSRLSSHFGGSNVTAKAFAVSQNAFSGKWDLTLAVTAAGSDHLFISQGNDYSTNTTVNPGVAWSIVQFDGDGQPPNTTKIQIADIFALNLPTGSTCIVDIWRHPGTNNSLDRYYITPDHSTQWNKHLLAIDLDAGSLTSVLGQRNRDQIPGIYTFGLIDGQSQLIYAPVYNLFRPRNPPSPARLAAPRGTTSISSAVDRNGHSCLFVSHPGGLSVFPPSAQGDGATPVLCLSGPLVAGATQLQAYTAGSITSVWGRNAQGGLFYSTCPAGSEGQPSIWSTPVALLPEIENFAFYNGSSTNSHTLFAHIDGENVIELDQDPITSVWRERKILLPSTAVNDMVEFDSYTTRIEILGDDLLPSPKAEISATSVSPVPVYINDVYYILNPDNPVTITADSNGAVTVVQQADSLSVVCYNVALATPNGPSALINPSAKAIQKLQAIQSGDDLAGVNVYDSSGQTKPLFPSSVSGEDRDAAADAIKQFSDINKGLNPDGSPSATSLSVNSVKALAVNRSAGDHVFSLAVDASAADGKRLNFSRPSPLLGNGNGSRLKGTTVLTGSSGSFFVKVGDFFQMLGHAVSSGLHTLEVRVINGVHHVFATIGGIMYHALLDCMSAIAHAICWVFRQIKILWDDLVAWLGFIFGWSDIVRTHSVMKNLIKQYVRKTFDEMAQAEEKIFNTFDGLEEKLNDWADVEDPGEKIGSFVGPKKTDDGFSSPQSHWGINHAKSNMASAQTSSNDDTSVLAGLEMVLNDIKALVVDEIDDIDGMIDQIRTQIIDPYHDLTPLQVVKRLVGIIGDLLLKSAKNVILKSLDVVRVLANTALNILDAPMKIPILSPLYKSIAGANLTVLDLVVLVLSIPATTMYKIMTGSAPFPDNSSTRALTSATSFQAIKDMTDPGIDGATIMPMMKIATVHEKLAAHKRDVVPTSGTGANVYRVFAIIGRFFGVGTAWFGQIVQDLRWSYIKVAKELPYIGDDIPNPITVCEAVNDVVSVIPTIINAFSRSSTWEVLMVDVIGGINVARTLVGVTPVGGSKIWKAVDPFAGVLMQLALIPPPCGNLADAVNQSRAKASDYVSLPALLFARFAGILNPVSLEIQDFKASAIVLGAANVCSLVQGALMFTSAGLFIHDK